jgi:hypothetical protein
MKETLNKQGYRKIFLETNLPQKVRKAKLDESCNHVTALQLQIPGSESDALFVIGKEKCSEMN